MTHDSPSRLHRVDADEIFHHYSGSVVEQLVVDAAGVASLRSLGSDLAAGQEPQAVVPAGAWQGCHVPAPEGWALLGCTVAPGFEFRGFALVTHADVEQLLDTVPEHADLLRRLGP